MSQYLVIGDTHCQLDNLDKIKQLFEIVEKTGLPTIWLGDLLHTKDIVRAQCLNTYYRYFLTSPLQHHILVGNHDWATSDCKSHSLEPLAALDNVTIFDTMRNLGSKLYIPYYRDNNLLRKHLTEFKDIKTIIGHLDIKSFDYGNGFISEEGLHLDELKDYELVISGHYHKFQRKDNIVYLGTPFSHDFGEANQDKYLAIFDDSALTLNPFKTSFPRHVSVEIDADSHMAALLDPADYNRIIVKGTKEQLDKFDYTPYKQFKVVQECISEIAQSELKETETPQTLYKTWFNDIKKSKDQELFKLGLNILEDVK